MSIVKEIHTEESIELSEMIAYLDGLGKLPLHQDLDGVMEQLRKLCNNKTFVTDTIRNQLSDLPSFERNNPYSSQVFLIHVCPNYALRVVIWEPPTGRVGEEVFFYEDLHDHNFDLLTIGYLGSGYETLLYNYAHDDVSGSPGETAAFWGKKKVRLAENRILLMETSSDVHAQYPPEEFSISLNVMQINKDDLNVQYEFDFPNRWTGRANVKNRTTYFDVESLSECLATLGCQEAPVMLKKGIEEEENPKNRMALFNALEHFEGKEAWAQAVNDCDPKIARKAARMIAQ